MKASDLFVKALAAEGVEFIFGIPGEENLDFLDSMRKSGKIQLILTRHEQAAGFMAATYGRLTGKVGVCLSTLGPGATNLVTAAGYAQLGAMPMLMITGQKPIKTSKQGQFQIIDVVEMMRPLTKYTHQIVSGSNIPSRVREAIRLAEEERPGAVHLELPEDVAAEETEDVLFPKDRVRRPTAEEKAIFRAVEMIEGAVRPLLLVGAGANRKRTSRILAQFIEHTGIPFFSTQMGKGVVDERHPLFLGNAALSSNDYLHCAVARADLIINVGHDVVEKPPFFMSHDGFQVIHINFSSASVDPVYFPELEVIGDIGNSIWQIICGDGGFMMNSQELETAVRLGMDLVILVLQDNAYGMIKWKQESMGLPDFGLDYGNPDFVRYAESYGAHGHLIEKTEDLIPVMQSCVDGSGVHLIVVPMDYSVNQKLLEDELVCPL